MIKKEPKCDGKFIFKDIQEDNCIISFDPPLMVEYDILDKIGEDGKENYSEDVPIMGYGKFDFGMEMMTPLNPEHNTLLGGYQGLSKESALEDILMYSLIYDLFHALCHPKEDPNYSHYHHALYAYLKDRVKIKGG